MLLEYSLNDDSKKAVDHAANQAVLAFLNEKIIKDIIVSKHNIENQLMTISFTTGDSFKIYASECWTGAYFYDFKDKDKCIGKEMKDFIYRVETYNPRGTCQILVDGYSFNFKCFRNSESIQREPEIEFEINDTPPECLVRTPELYPELMQYVYGIKQL